MRLVLFVLVAVLAVVSAEKINWVDNGEKGEFGPKELVCAPNVPLYDVTKVWTKYQFTVKQSEVGRWPLQFRKVSESVVCQTLQYFAHLIKSDYNDWVASAATILPAFNYFRCADCSVEKCKISCINKSKDNSCIIEMSPFEKPCFTVTDPISVNDVQEGDDSYSFLVETVTITSTISITCFAIGVFLIAFSRHLSESRLFICSLSLATGTFALAAILAVFVVGRSKRNAFTLAGSAIAGLAYFARESGLDDMVHFFYLAIVRVFSWGFYVPVPESVGELFEPYYEIGNSQWIPVGGIGMFFSGIGALILLKMMGLFNDHSCEGCKARVAKYQLKEVICLPVDVEDDGNYIDISKAFRLCPVCYEEYLRDHNRRTIEHSNINTITPRAISVAVWGFGAFFIYASSYNTVFSFIAILMAHNLKILVKFLCYLKDRKNYSNPSDFRDLMEEEEYEDVSDEVTQREMEKLREHLKSNPAIQAQLLSSKDDSHEPKLAARTSQRVRVFAEDENVDHRFVAPDTPPAYESVQKKKRRCAIM